MSSRARMGLAIALALAPSCALLQAQTSDPRAVAILQASLVAAGGTRGLANIQDFTATGTITYFWAGQQVPGTATVKGRGSDQWRLDANLTQGTRSLAVSHGRGALKEGSGTISQLPLHNTINVGILTFPYLTIAAALNDPLTTISYVGVVTIAGRQANQVRVQRHFVRDSQGALSNLAITDYFIDGQTNLVVKSTDMTHPTETFGRSYPRDVELQSYTGMSGLNLPTLVRERVSGQAMWELRVTNIALNTGLTDTDFIVQ